VNGLLSFEEKYKEWIHAVVSNETNPRRREWLEKGLGHSSVEFLRKVWFPVVGNFDHLYPEWEVCDFNNDYRYIDFAYMPGGLKCGVEIQGYGPHARDLDTRRFIDLCKRDFLLALDGWSLFPIAYLSIRDEPKFCQQLILSFIGKFTSIDVPDEFSCLEAEVFRLAHRLLRPITPREVAEHLKVSVRHARTILYKLSQKQILTIASGKSRARTYKLNY
jgi:hypothetical protein